MVQYLCNYRWLRDGRHRTRAPAAFAASASPRATHPAARRRGRPVAVGRVDDWLLRRKLSMSSPSAGLQGVPINLRFAAIQFYGEQLDRSPSPARLPRVSIEVSGCADLISFVSNDVRHDADDSRGDAIDVQLGAGEVWLGGNEALIDKVDMRTGTEGVRVDRVYVQHGSGDVQGDKAGVQGGTRPRAYCGRLDAGRSNWGARAHSMSAVAKDRVADGAIGLRHRTDYVQRVAASARLAIRGARQFPRDCLCAALVGSDGKRALRPAPSTTAGVIQPVGVSAGLVACAPPSLSMHYHFVLAKVVSLIENAVEVAGSTESFRQWLLSVRRLYDGPVITHTLVGTQFSRSN